MRDSLLGNSISLDALLAIKERLFPFGRGLYVLHESKHELDALMLSGILMHA